MEKFRYIGENDRKSFSDNQLNGITIAWKNLNVFGTQSSSSSFLNLFYKREGVKKQIISDCKLNKLHFYQLMDYMIFFLLVNGIAKPGQILAVMGSSGSGR